MQLHEEMRSAMFEGASAVMYVLSLCDRSSFEYVQTQVH